MPRAVDPGTPRADPSILGNFRLEEQVGFLLRRATQRIAAIFADAMAETDLTPRQFAALVKVVELGQVTQNRLGRLVAMDPATIQGVAQRLIARNLLTRAADPLDRRTAVLAPTQAGLALAARGIMAVTRITRAALEPLTPEESSRLLSLLRKIG